jgi:restriction system protein
LSKLRKKQNNLFFYFYTFIILFFIIIFYIKYVILLTLIAGSIFIIYKIIKYNKSIKEKRDLLLRTSSLNQLLYIFHNNPYDFEKYIANYFHLSGYKNVKTTIKSNDLGKDIIMFDKNNSKIIVEVKLYSKHNLIDRPKIQKFHSAMIDENAKGIFVTTSDFTGPAYQFSKKHNINLMNGDTLIENIIALKAKINEIKAKKI